MFWYDVGVFTEDQLRAVAAILREVRTSMAAKLRWGERVREELRAAEARGEKVTGYRPDWVVQSRRRVLELLQECAKEFNATYPHDCISVADYQDVLLGVSRALQRVTEKK